MSEKLDLKVENALESTVKAILEYPQAKKAFEQISAKLTSIKEPDILQEAMKEVFAEISSQLPAETRFFSDYMNILVGYQNSRFSKKLAEYNRKISILTIILGIFTAISALGTIYPIIAPLFR